MMRLTSAHFAEMFGTDLDEKTAYDITAHDWRYTPVDTEASNKAVLDLLRRIETRSFSVAGENIERWQKGWDENLVEFRRTGDTAALDPKYLRPAKLLRLGGRFVEPADPMFEVNWYRVFRGWFARRFLSSFDHIYEFGCGSGHNLAFLAQEFPDKQIHGHDWCAASVEIVGELHTMFPNVSGSSFDFFKPSQDWEFAPNSAVLTIGALEQTGLRWRPFLDFLKRTQPAMCFHVEPVVEWYDPDSLVDYTAAQVHDGRGFWRGFVEAVPLLRKHRTGFGSLLLEGYSQMAWKP